MWSLSLCDKLTQLAESDAAFIREMPPVGSFSKALCFQLGTSLNTSWFLWSCSILSRRDTTITPGITGKCAISLSLSCLVDSVTGETSQRGSQRLAWFVGRCLIKGFMPGRLPRTQCFAHSQGSLYFICWRKWLTIYFLCSFLIGNNPFSLKSLNLIPSQDLSRFPLLLHIHFLLT